MSLTEQFARASKHSGADEARVRRVLAGLKFLGLPGTSLWSGDGKAAKPLFLKETGRLEALSLTSVQADVRGLATRLRAHSTFQANLVASADVFEPRSGLTSGLFVGGLFLLPDDQDEGEDDAPMPEEAIKVLLDLHALPLLCRLLDFKEGCPKTSAQLLGLADLLLPDPEVQRGLVQEFASKLWPGGDEADPTKLRAQEQEALLLEAVLWRLAALKAAICDHKVMGADFELLPFTAPKRPAAAPAGFLDASWGDLPNLIADQTAVRKRQTNEQEDEAEQPSHKRRPTTEREPRGPSPPRRTYSPDPSEDEDGSSSSSAGYKSPSRVASRKSKEPAARPVPLTTPEEERQQSRQAGQGGWGRAGQPTMYAELETDLDKDPGPDDAGTAFMRTRARSLMVQAFAAMSDGELFPPAKNKLGAFSLAKALRGGSMRIVKHSFFMADVNKGCRAMCMTPGPMFDSYRALSRGLSELGQRTSNLAAQQKDGQPTHGYLARRASKECTWLINFNAVLQQLLGQHHNETQMLFYAASALYLYFASGDSAWLTQPHHMLWEELRPLTGLHCDMCGQLGHLSGGHAKVQAYCLANSITKVMDACQFPPDKVANLPAVPKPTERGEQRRSSPARRPSNLQRDSFPRGWRDREHGDGGWRGGGGHYGRDRGDRHRDGHQENSHAPAGGQQHRQRGRHWQGGDRNGQRSR